MKRRFAPVFAAALALALTSGVALADPSSSATTSSSPSSTAMQQTHLTNIKTKGDAEITRRLASLSSLAALISSVTRLAEADRSTLSNEVAMEQTGLQQLKGELDGATTLAQAIPYAQDIYTEYRVYALVLPKVHIVKTADDQQVTEVNLTALASKLQTRLSEAKGENVSQLQSELSALNSKVSAAQAISGQMEASVIGLQPSDYNSNHSVLSGDVAQLQAAHADNEAAFADAKNIVAGLKSSSAS